MKCKIHNQPKTLTCARCDDSVCPMCAEYIDGSWFCPHCAVKERRIAAGLDYRDIMAIGMVEPSPGDEATDFDVAEI